MSDVRIESEGAIGRMRLDRPKALHALTHGMCATMIEALQGWRGDHAIEAILLDHAEGRGFCAGGDVRAIADSGAADGAAARAFFATEYHLNHLMFTYAKPIVAFMDGVTMGGGVGIALPARYRIATERTLFAMPEATIGLFPDVGGGWYLPRLPGRIGAWLALTVARLDGAACKAIGIATHYLPSDALPDVKAAIAARPREIEAILAAAEVEPALTAALDARDAIDRLFVADRLEDILDALDGDGSDWATAQAATIRAKSPLSCKVALKLIADGAHQADFGDEMRVEYGVAAHLCQRHDFLEGVRALLIDKDNAPRWDPATPEGVSDHMIDLIFAPLPDGEAWVPLGR